MSTARSHHSDQPYSTFDRMPYVFGSSTPREFSYMYQIPAKFRVYDVKLRPSRSRDKSEMSLSDYIRRMRSSSPFKRRRDRSVDAVMGGRSYVFGSSTPRKWSFMEKLPVEYRIYDVRLNGFSHGKRSKTTSFADYGVNSATHGTTTAKAQSLSGGVPHRGDSAADNHSAKSTARTRSVPPSSRKQAGHSASRHSDSRSSSSSSRPKRPKDITDSHPVGRTSSSSTKSFNKNHSSLTTPNEELMLVVTETVTNLPPSHLLTNGNRQEEEGVLSSHDESADIRALSSSIENSGGDNVHGTIVVGKSAADHVIQEPSAVVNDSVVHDPPDNRDHDDDSKGSSRDDHDSAVDKTKNSLTPNISNDHVISNRTAI